MKKNNVLRIVKWIAIVIGGIFIAYVGYIFIALWIALSPVETDYKVEIPSTKETAYFKVVKSGINGNNQRIFLRSEPKDAIEYDSTTDYMWEGLHPIYYEVKDSTLYVYSLTVSGNPSNFLKKFKIKFIYQMPQALWDMRETYKEKGLTIIE